MADPGVLSYHQELLLLLADAIIGLVADNVEKKQPQLPNIDFIKIVLDIKNRLENIFVQAGEVLLHFCWKLVLMRQYLLYEVYFLHRAEVLQLNS